MDSKESTGVSIVSTKSDEIAEETTEVLIKVTKTVLEEKMII